MHLPIERRGQAEIVEQRGSKLLDDPALDLHAVVERLQRPLQLRRRFGIAPLDALLHPGHVHLGADEHAAELVVDVAGELRLFVLANDLQVVRQLRQVGGALLDDRFEPPLVLLHAAAALARAAVASRRASSQTIRSSATVNAVMICMPTRANAMSPAHLFVASSICRR